MLVICGGAEKRRRKGQKLPSTQNFYNSCEKLKTNKKLGE